MFEEVLRYIRDGVLDTLLQVRLMCSACGFDYAQESLLDLAVDRHLGLILRSDSFENR